MFMRRFVAGLVACALISSAHAGMSFAAIELDGSAIGAPTVTTGASDIDFYADEIVIGLGQGTETKTLQFTYHAIADAGYLLDSLWLSVTGAIFGGADITIEHEIRDGVSNALLFSDTFLLDAGNPPPASEFISFGPAQHVVVSKTMTLEATAIGDLAGLLLVEEAFNQQVIPEPGSVLLGVLGLGIIARRSWWRRMA